MKIRIITALIIISALTGCSESGDLPEYTSPKTAWEAAAEKTDIPQAETAASTTVQTTTVSVTAAVTQPVKDISIDLHDTDGNDTNYIFTYKGEEFSAVYTPDNWHITDSCKITDMDDITSICQALTDIHPIHTKDRQSYRTADSLAYEWNEHNSAYKMLDDDSEWKDNVKDVDLDPDDEGKSLWDMAMDRLNAQNE